MKTQRKQLFTKAVAWLVAEVVLNLAGLDNLADYSEFVFDQHSATTLGAPTITTALLLEQL